MKVRVLMLQNTRETYGLIAQLLHWITAILILILIPLGIYMHELPRATAEDATRAFWYFSLHKTLGIAGLFVAVVRVGWACFQPHPYMLNRDRRLESLAAQTIHWTLYGAIIVMPLSGWLHHSATVGFAPIWWPLGQDLPLVPKNDQVATFFAAIHLCTAILLGMCIALHIAGALKHAIADRDGTLRRMIPGLTVALSSAPVAPHFKQLPKMISVLAFVVVGAASTVIFTQSRSHTNPAATTPKQMSVPTSGWRVDKEKSRLGIKVTQSGSPTDGEFQNWRAGITLDPEQLDRASISVEIDIASLKLGGVSDEAIAPDMLNATTYPTAHFRSNDIKKTGDQTYEAKGEITLAGRTKPLTLPFTLNIDKERAFAQAQITLNRLAYGVGKKAFPKGTVVGLEVQVDIKIEADRAKP